MDSLISVRRQDETFFSYMKGTFSSQWRAIPTESLNLDLKKDYITFRLIPIERVPHVSIWQFILKVFRLDGLSFSVGGLIATLFFLQAIERTFSFGLAISCFIPVICLHIAMNLFNDYYDHVRGVDRIGSVKSIQIGWVRAIDLYNWGWIALGLGIFSGVFILAASTAPIYLIVALAAFGILEFSSNRFGLKYLGYGEITLFLLTGPLLVVGFVLAVNGNLQVRDLALGGFLGLLTLLFMHLNNLREILSAAQAGVSNIVTRNGFDKSKRILGFMLILSSFVWWNVLILMHKSPWAFGPWIAGGIIFKYIFAQVLQSASPMSSVLRSTVQKRFLLHLLVLICVSVSFMIP
ncbi:MAG: hypothetical protein A4S09_09655 [Proteobacteria bacterium SG_bin7]|nr:MAG: hypothetical protein A4S09_09655 [Proteobacteria bacterium SG_bin7]